MIEKRFVSGELRAEQTGGQTYLVGRAASYDVVSKDLGGWRERLEPGCFDDVLAEPDLDVVHTVNHDVSRILGRTTSGTLQLTSNARGLNYRTRLPSTTYAQDLAELCRRGDISSSSFAFTVDPSGERWSEITDPENAGARCSLRTISRIASLHDVSTVVNAAYPATAAELAGRSLPPPGMPVELRNKILLRAADDAAEQCGCDCPECVAGDCPDCSNPACDDESCRGCPYSMRSSDGAGAKTKRVDGEDLPQSAFLIHGSEDDTNTWKLPVRFSTLAKSEKHVRLAVDLLSTLADVSESEKERARQELEALAKKYGIEIDTEDDRAIRERRLELAMME